VGVGGAIGVTLIEKDTRAFVGNNAVVDAKGNSSQSVSAYSELDDEGNFAKKNIKGLSVQAESGEDFNTITGAFAGGFAGLAGAVVVNTVESDTTAYIGDAAQVNQDRVGVNGEQDVNVSAVNDVTDFAVSGSIAGGAVGLAGGLGFHTIKNDTSAYLGNGAKVNASRDVELNALAGKEAETYAVSAAGGLVGVGGGVTVLTIGNMPDNTTASSLSSKGGNDGYENPSSYAESQAQYDILGGALSDSYGMGDAKTQAAEATTAVSVTPTGALPAGTAAFIGRSATVDAGGDIQVNAKERIDVNIKSGAAAVGGFASVGGGVGIANVRSQVRAYIDDDDPNFASSINAQGDIGISARLYEKALNNAYAGGLSTFVAVSGAVSYIDNDYLVDARIGNGVTIDEADDVSVTATTFANNTAKSLEGAFGGLGVAVGVSYAEVDSDGSTLAHVGEGVEIGKSDDETKSVNDLSVTASSSNKADTDSKHISGGIIFAGGYNKSDSSVNPKVEAAVGHDARIRLRKDLTISGRSDVEINATASSLAFGAVGLNGVRTNNTVYSTADAYIGQDADVEAGEDVLIAASNKVTKANIGVNLKAGAGGLFGGPAGDSFTNITNIARAYIAGNSNASSGSKVTADQDVTLSSINDVFAYDKGALTAGGAIAVAEVNSTITNSNTATSSIGENAEVAAGNDVNVDSKTSANVEAVTYTEGFGLGASADGKAEVTVTADNDANIAGNAAVEAGNDINVFAGRDPDGWQNSLRARSEARSFSAGGIPFSSVKGLATLNNYNDIMIAAGAELKSGRDINLGSFRGGAFVEGYARAKLRTYLLFGIPITWYNDGARSSVNNASDTVTVNGSAESGLNRHKIMHIDPLGNVSSDSNIVYTLLKNINAVQELDARIADLDARIAKESDDKVKMLLSEEKGRYEQDRTEILDKRKTDSTFGWFDRFTLEDTRVGSGDINITGTLKGEGGLLKVPAMISRSRSSTIPLPTCS
jgi:hypothetical protein